MKKIIVIAFIIVASFSFAQTVKGVVLDEQNKPLSGANIYFDSTTIATISDENGNFTLYYGAKINSVLAISFIGYQTQFIHSFNQDEKLTIVLKEAIDKLNEVVILKDRFSRKQKMKLFKEQFLGLTNAGKKAVILNENEIYFEYNESKRTLFAFSDKPLLIDNLVLGYKISYEMVNFEVNFKNVSMNSDFVARSLFAGLCRFEEISSTSKNLKERQKCYKGSQLHFFRNLVNNIWDKDNFLLYKGSFQDNPSNYFTITDYEDSKKVEVKKQKESLRNEKFVAAFNLLFEKKQQSKIIFETDTFYVDQFGNNSNVNDIFFSGYISKQKVGDLLPLNYGIHEKTP